MSKGGILGVKNNDPIETLGAFFRDLLEKEVVEALLIPKKLPSGDGYCQTLIRNPEMLADVNPLAPTLPVQSARIISHLTITDPGCKVGAVLKSCEIRAVIELVKFLQVKLDKLVLIGVDCLGTYEPSGYAKMIRERGEGVSITGGLLKGAHEGRIEPQDGYDLRLACQICEYPSPQDADIIIGLFGHDPQREIFIQLRDQLATELAEKGILATSEEGSPSRDQVIESLTEKRIRRRDEVFDAFRSGTKSLQDLMDALSTCIRCHNCMVACPICYCKECVFRTPTLEHKADQFLRWADRKGGVRMPTDTLLFHLIRLSHMVTSCIGCGLCDSACPNGLPVATLFRAVGQRVQGMFDYTPGRSVDEEPPVATFREDELQTESGSL
ncbi:MAG: 4Fe-4S dicluster domain-containing protein [Thermodesulfobacteriota bacterium]